MAYFKADPSAPKKRSLVPGASSSSPWLLTRPSKSRFSFQLHRLHVVTVPAQLPDPIDPSWPSCQLQKAHFPSDSILVLPKIVGENECPFFALSFHVQSTKQASGTTALAVPPNRALRHHYHFTITSLSPSSHSRHLSGTLSDIDSVADALASSHLHQFPSILVLFSRHISCPTQYLH